MEMVTLHHWRAQLCWSDYPFYCKCVTHLLTEDNNVIPITRVPSTKHC